MVFVTSTGGKVEQLEVAVLLVFGFDEVQLVVGYTQLVVCGFVIVVQLVEVITEVCGFVEHCLHL